MSFPFAKPTSMTSPNGGHRPPGDFTTDLHVLVIATTSVIVATAGVIVSLHPETENMINEKTLALMKRGTYLVNTARAKLVDRDAVVKALESGQLAGYAGDVWYPQPAPASHPWRTMPHEGMTPHTSGSTLSAQARYSAGTREILECFYSGRPIREKYLIAQGGHLAGAGAHSYSVR